MALTFDDSFARLGWVEHLVGLVRSFVAGVEDQVRHGQLVFETASVGSLDYAQYRLDEAVPIPSQLGFLIADIATNARSCLDMAVQNIVDMHTLPVGNPQFPIDDDVAAPTDRTRKLLNEVSSVSPAIADALRSLQPLYDLGPGLGRVDIPMNHEALMIREVSNANKHRNITPAIRQRRMTGFSFPSDSRPALEIVPDDDAPFAPSDAVVLTVRYPSGSVSDSELATLRVTRGIRLQITDTRYTTGSTGIALPIDVSEFLDGAPAYVRKALNTIQRAA